MKLRIKGNSLRLRLGPSEIARLLESGRMEESIRLGLETGARLTYVLELVPSDQELSLRYRPQEIAVLLSHEEARRWAQGEQVGISGEISFGNDKLLLLLEKDWACVDRAGEENEDTFPNPKAGATC